MSKTPQKETVKYLENKHVGFRVRRETWSANVEAILLFVGSNKVFLQMFRNEKKAEEQAISNCYGHRNWILR